MNSLEITQNKRYKLFLVEEDDELRERVLSGLVESAEIKVIPNEPEINHLLDSTLIFNNYGIETYTIKFELKKRENGTYFTIENFYEESLCDHEEDF